MYMCISHVCIDTRSSLYLPRTPDQARQGVDDAAGFDFLVVDTAQRIVPSRGKCHGRHAYMCVYRHLFIYTKLQTVYTHIEYIVCIYIYIQNLYVHVER